MLLRLQLLRGVPDLTPPGSTSPPVVLTTRSNPLISLRTFPCAAEITDYKLLGGVPDIRNGVVANFVSSLFKLYSDLYFTYLEINPLGKLLL